VHYQRKTLSDWLTKAAERISVAQSGDDPYLAKINVENAIHSLQNACAHLVDAMD